MQSAGLAAGKGDKVTSGPYPLMTPKGEADVRELLENLVQAYRARGGLDVAHDAALRAAENFLAPMPSIDMSAIALDEAHRVVEGSLAVIAKELRFSMATLEVSVSAKGSSRATVSWQRNHKLHCFLQKFVTALANAPT